VFGLGRSIWSRQAPALRTPSLQMMSSGLSSLFSSLDAELVQPLNEVVGGGMLGRVTDLGGGGGLGHGVDRLLLAIGANSITDFHTRLATRSATSSLAKLTFKGRG
jgi:hypothetical protein